MKIILILISLIIFIFVIKLTKGWFSPARISVTIWTFLIVGYNLLSTKEISYSGMFYLIFCSLLLALGEYYGVKFKIIFNKKDFKVKVGNLSWSILIIFILLAMTYNGILILKNGFNISYFFDINKFLNMNSSMSYQRYYGNTVKTMWESILSTFIYVSSLYGGYLYLHGENKKQKYLCIIGIIPALINVLFQNMKLILLDSIFLWFIGYAISYLMMYKKNPKIKLKSFLIIVTIVLVMGSVFFFSMCTKIGKLDGSTMKLVQEKFAVYAFGSIEAFSIWFSKVTNINYGLGVNTFLAPFDLLGIVERIQGVYEFMSGVDSNIFTGYRALIDDFGKPFSMIIVIIFGFISGIAYRNLLDDKLSRVGILLYACCLFTILHYWLGSPWVYTSYWLTFVLFGIALVLSKYNLKGIRK